ncbi:MAG: serine/threonine protein kinase, partial [Actinobacteria bacterium]
ILVVRDHAYLADFGLTKAVGVESITRSGPLLGTLDYVAPEQIRGEEVDSRADVYSLGAVLFECLTGSVPFKRSTDVAVLYAHLEQEPPSVQTLRSELPAAIDEVITRGMAKVPARRQESAGQLIAEAAQALREGPRHTRLRRELEAAGDTTTLPTAPVTTSPGESSTSSWRVRASLAMAALLAVAVGIAGGSLLPGT